MWALGVIYYALLHGRLPFDGLPNLDYVPVKYDNFEIQRKIISYDYQLDSYVSETAKVNM